MDLFWRLYMVLADPVPKEYGQNWKGQRRDKNNNQSVGTTSTKREIELFKVVWDGDNLVEEIWESKSGMEPT